MWSAVPVFMFVQAMVPAQATVSTAEYPEKHDDAAVAVSSNSECNSQKLTRRERQKRSEKKAKTVAPKKRSDSNAASSTSSDAGDSIQEETGSTTHDETIDFPTTVIIRNLSKDCTRDALVQLLDSEDFAGLYDMVHVPVGFQDLVGLGHALVNFVNHDVAELARMRFDGACDKRLTSEACEAGWSNTQGLTAHIKKYRDSPTMHESIPNEFKPAMFKDGQQVPFPEPTKRIRAPRVRHQKSV
jgi:hypothetical protein